MSTGMATTSNTSTCDPRHFSALKIRGLSAKRYPLGCQRPPAKGCGTKPDRGISIQLVQYKPPFHGVPGMNIAKSIFEFIEKNPGKMLRDIIAAFPETNR
jgi:hypothetical protein